MTNTIQPKPYQKGSQEFAMFAEYYNLLKTYPTPPVTSEHISQAFVDAWWEEVHNQYVAFGEKYTEIGEKCNNRGLGRKAVNLAITAMEELDAIARELTEEQEKMLIEEDQTHTEEQEGDYSDIFI